MPELPEVETIKQQLQAILPLPLQQIRSSSFLKDRIWSHHHSPLLLKKQTIISIDRYGKQLIMATDRGQFLICGLGMSGSWRISTSSLMNKVAHTHLELSDGEQKFLSYIDPRRFGKIRWFKNEKEKNEYLKNMGTDVSDPHLKGEKIKELLLHYPARPIKRTLLDQKLFAGIGNYLASEICAHAKIHPLRLCHDLKKNDFIAIKRAIRLTLTQSLNKGGATFHGGYQDAHGEKGEGLQGLVVFYQKTCGLCKKGKITKFYLDGRGTYFCPDCQPLTSSNEA